MSRTRSAALILAATFIIVIGGQASVAIADEPFLLSFAGLHYECAVDGTGDPSPDTLLAIGDGYAFVGEVTTVADALLSVFSPVGNQYTVVISGGAVLARNVTASGHLQVIMSGNMRLHVFEEPVPGGTAATYAPHPPNGEVPSNFVDGIVVLEAALTYFALQWTPSEGVGNWSADAQLSDGTWLPLIQTKDYRIGGGFFQSPIPEGYHSRSQSEAVAPVDVHGASWGQLKTLYR